MGTAMTGEAVWHLTDWLTEWTASWLTDKGRQRHRHHRNSDGDKRWDTDHVRVREASRVLQGYTWDSYTKEYVNIILLIVLTLQRPSFSNRSKGGQDFTQPGSSLSTQGFQLMDHWVLYLEISPQNEFSLSVSVALCCKLWGISLPF